MLVGEDRVSNKILTLFTSSYTQNDKLIKSLLPDGKLDSGNLLVPDFGDVLPYLYYFGLKEFCETQIQYADSSLRQGLFVRGGKVRLFLNHDWLFGLLELYRLTGRIDYLDKLEKGLQTVSSNYFYNNKLTDEPFSYSGITSFLGRSKEFNGGYIELYSELSSCTSNKTYLEVAENLAKGIESDPLFHKTGLIGRKLSVYFPVADRVLRVFSNQSVKLFKGNTNTIYGVLALYKQSPEVRWRELLLAWVDGFEKYFWNHGMVYLELDNRMRPRNVSLKAAFSALDLLVQLYENKILPRSKLYLVHEIARSWIRKRWANGLFPLAPGGNKDHLDANTDMAIAISRLGHVTGDSEYFDIALEVKESIWKNHMTDFGLVNQISDKGEFVDPRIYVKYQSLYLKLVIIEKFGFRAFEDPVLEALLQDR